MKNYKKLNYLAILDAIPSMIFVVDSDIRILYVNDAAAEVFGKDKAKILKRRGGEVLHCLHAYDVPGGCGRAPLCRSCVIRNSVTNSLKGNAVTRKRTKVELLSGGAKKEIELLITASLLPSHKDPLSLLVIEDITEISTLRDILPICTHCKKIRDDQQYWQNVEAYFNENIGVQFSHGICPSCMKELYSDFV